MATGEAAPRPTIHVWDPDTLEPLRVIKGYHAWEISCLAFADGLSNNHNNATGGINTGQAKDLLVAAGGDKHASVVLYNWRQAGVKSMAPEPLHPSEVWQSSPQPGWTGVVGDNNQVFLNMYCNMPGVSLVAIPVFDGTDMCLTTLAACVPWYCRICSRMLGFKG